MIVEIDSRWETERGRWNEATNNYVDRYIEEGIKVLTMEIKESDSGNKILQFHGGPTGYEGYYIKDLFDYPIKGEELCICAGTINRWSACFVNNKEVMDFLNTHCGTVKK